MHPAPSETPLTDVKKGRGLGAEFWRCNLGNLLVLTGSVMFVLLPAYMDDKGMTRWEIGFADGAFWLISVFVQPWLGPRLDQDGRKRYLVIGSLLMGIAASLYAFVPVALVPMLLLRVVHGLGFAMYLTASWTWVADYAPRGRVGELFGIFGIAGLISGAVGPGAAEWMRNTYNYNGLFFLGSGLILCGWCFLLTLNDRAPRLDAVEKLPHFFRMITTRAMRGTAIGSLGFGVAVGSIFAFVAPYLDSLNVAGVGGMFACTTLASGASRVYAGRQTDRIGPGRLIVPALLLLSAGCYGLCRVADSGYLVVPVLIGSGLAAGMGYGVIYPALNALALKRLIPAARGRGLSVVTAAIDLGSTAGAGVAGVVSHNFGYPTGFFAISLLVLIIAGAFVLSERSQAERPPAAEVVPPPASD